MARERRRSRRGESRPSLQPGKAWLRIKNPYPPIAQFSDDEIEAIHLTSLNLLRDKGIKVLSTEARERYREAGAQVNEETLMVRFDPDMLLQTVGQAPPGFTMHGRSADRWFEVGDNNLVFATVGGPPHYSDLEDGRRAGTHDAFRDLLRMAQNYDVIHLTAPMVEPQDLPTPVRHLHMTRSVVTLTDKPTFIYSRGREAVADSLEILRIAHGIDQQAFEDRVHCYTVVNANSPLQLDELMCAGIIDFAKARQAMILTPFTLAGAMAPVTLPGALAQQNAEALAGIALAQIARPGAPVVYGGFTSNVDMKTGAPAFGTPEYVKAAFASGQLARRYRLPYRTSNVNTSNAPDAQSAYESQMSCWGAIMGGCNILLHGAGWLEGGLTASLEKFVIDVEMLQMFASLMQPVACNEETLAASAFDEIEPGGHFFGTQHTLARYETAFYVPLLSDWSNFEAWTANGAVDTTHRANRIARKALAEFTPPALDQARLEEIDAFVEQRVRAGGASLSA
ncbi:MAG TPA: methyltransferase [Gammaproteobacteria bacterium]|jgi:trimethylamine--corrinoid protein Co-methyltransferase|nr:methyltransferase [Acidiferrobacteraceae bacterium]MDP6551947.1 trimethylamine methyltransferase family protein [Arenicellales bacterium]MDP6792285.1 trimethylamine methyltransferase family protein [Arenicellales bacterium]MDP6919417.1 trimethylamine methyltransferase family protein [Arenicellales bacterium]HCX87017.1 methyltransferase [Gammaproteobacteria bacterium]|tara:strand:- start:1078 stop:2607 length:1530 start_codon:yes stop_codon:yes gene_type:complete